MDKKFVFNILNLEKLTKEQNTAILNDNLPILISASAGSGKTTVLSKRYIYKLLTSNGLKTTRNMLVLTFAKSAANEMFERIFDIISNISRQYPKNLTFQKIKNSISKNLITTIDSFCFNIIKENFRALNISPNFKLVSNLESSQIKDKILNILFEIEQQKNRKEFQKICNYFKLKDISGFKTAILKIYDKSKTMPFPKLYIKNLVNQYNNPKDLENSDFLIEIKQDILEKIYEIKNILLLAINNLKQNLYELNLEAYIKKTILNIDNIKNKINKIPYSELKILLENFKFESFPKYNKKNDPFNPVVIDQIKKIYINPAKKIMTTIKENLISNEQYLNDFKEQKKIANAIVNFSLKFYSKFENHKKESNILEFSDLVTKTLSLLSKISSSEKISLTDLGKKFSNKFKEVLIDEFQDINRAQNLLIKILSNNNKNLFAVGDLKQSIYGFRDADTSIFLNKKNKYQNNPKKGTLINLNKNFRSKIEVINTVNFLFSNIMTSDFGKIDYKTSEKLESTAIDKNKEYATELHILKNDEETNSLEFEISHIANIIYNMLKEKFQIYENGIYRDCAPKDFAVLFRSDKTAINMLCEKLSKLNINFFCLNNVNFLQSYEISILISLLKIIDNPFFDIPFCAVALSPMFNFSNQEILDIKINNQNKSLFTCFKKSKNKKCKILISILKKLKKTSINKNLEYLIHEICNINYFLKMYTKTKFNIINSKNLELFLQISKEYDEYTKFGIAGFIKYLDSIKSENIEINLNSTSYNNAVNIMTIHKSKGLEFPIVILPLTSKKFNEKDFKQPLLISPKFGLALKNSSAKNLTRYNTIPFTASSIYEKLSQKEEEQRLLYVATTRAKNKIIFTATDNSNKFDQIKTQISNIKKDYYVSFRSKNNFYDWILLTFFNKTTIKTQKNDIKIKNSDFDCQFIIKKIENKHTLKQLKDDKITQLDLNLLRSFKKQIFKNKSSKIKVPNKISVSEIIKQDHIKNNTKFTLKEPTFSYEIDKTPTNIGTITHIFLQYANFENAEKNLNLEIKRLIEKEFITAQQAKLLNKQNLKNFFSSHAFNIIKNSDKIEREKKFLCEINSKLIFKKADNEKILIQGIIDCIIEKNNQITIIDYKTDILNEQKLINRYKKQIKLYEYAIKKITKKEITASMIYSTYLNKSIIIKNNKKTNHLHMAQR